MSSRRIFVALSFAVSIWSATAHAETVFVKSTGDSGPNTLRAALTFANVHPGSTIAFSVPRAMLKEGVATIKIKSALPPIMGKGTRLDGTTQARFIGDTNPKGPEIVISGEEAELPWEQTTGGLLILSDHCVVSGLVINGFHEIGSGIILSGDKATENRITGCYVGTDATGTAQVSNAFGIFIFAGAHHNIIGGTTASSRNLISGNNSMGIGLFSAGTDHNVVQGNFIGTDVTGTIKLPNRKHGIQIVSGPQHNVIGGTEAGARNLISGNDWTGICLGEISTTHNIVQGNYVGTDVTGAIALSNKEGGILLKDDAKENLIGGPQEGAGNLISGHEFSGIMITRRARSNTVQGNRIGTDAAGMAALPNENGVLITEGAQDNIIGGAQKGAGNLISGNKGVGLAILKAGANNNVAQGNIVGLNATTNAPLPNQYGVLLNEGATGNRIGGAAAEAANIIAGNRDYGISIAGDNTQKNIVQGNFIGTNGKQSARLVNGSRGVRLIEGAHDNIIGGRQPGEANTILAQKGALSITGDKTTGNLTQGNNLDSAVVGQWVSGQTKNEFTSLDWDVTLQMGEVKVLGETGDNQNADFAFRFQYTGGAHRLDIAWAELLENGKPLSRDTHPGSTGNDDKDNEYRFSLPTVNPQAIYTLRASILSGGDSNGEIQLSRKPPRK